MTDRKQIEYRHVEDLIGVTRQKESDGLTIEGRAAVYDTETNIGWFKEKIDPAAFDNSLREQIDVEFLIGHQGLPLARTSSGTLALESRTDGLYVESSLDASDPDVQRIVPKMERGDLNKMSIGFYVLEEKWSLPDDMGLRTRTVLEAELFDVSIVSNPAYDETSISVAKRSLERHVTAERLSGSVMSLETMRHHLDLFQKTLEVSRP